MKNTLIILFAISTFSVSAATFVAGSVVCINETPNTNGPYYTTSGDCAFSSTNFTSHDLGVQLKCLYYNFDRYPDGNHPNACRPYGAFFGIKISETDDTITYKPDGYQNSSSVSKTCNNKEMSSFDRAVVTVDNGHIVHISLTGGIVQKMELKCVDEKDRASIGFGKL